MIGVNIDNLKQLLLKHRVPEEKIKSATLKFRDLNKEVAKLHKKVAAAGDFRTANMALKRIQKLMRQADATIAELLEDAKHENMSNNRKGKGK